MTSTPGFSGSALRRLGVLTSASVSVTAWGAERTFVGYPRALATDASGAFTFELSCAPRPQPVMQTTQKIAEVVNETQDVLGRLAKRIDRGFERISCELRSLDDDTAPSCAQAPVDPVPSQPQPPPECNDGPIVRRVTSRGEGAALGLQVVMHALSTQSKVKVVGTVSPGDPLVEDIAARSLSLP